MKILTKQGCWLAEINDRFMEFAETIQEVWDRWGDTPTITSGADGKHMEGSRHYTNEGWDVRSWGLHNPAQMADELRVRLKEKDPKWVVLYGDQYHKDHIHVGYGG